jgi:hypothetical protein
VPPNGGLTDIGMDRIGRCRDFPDLGAEAAYHLSPPFGGLALQWVSFWARPNFSFWALIDVDKVRLRGIVRLT